MTMLKTMKNLKITRTLKERGGFIYINKHVTSSVSCAGRIWIFVLITSFVIAYMLTSFVIAYLITSFLIAYLITSFVITYLITFFVTEIWHRHSLDLSN